MFICRGPRFDLVAHGTMKLQDVNDSVGTYDLVVEAATGKVLVKHLTSTIVNCKFCYRIQYPHYKSTPVASLEGDNLLVFCHLSAVEFCRHQKGWSLVEMAIYKRGTIVMNI